MKCNNCGKEIVDESKFCQYCGAMTDDKTEKEDINNYKKIKDCIVKNKIKCVCILLIIFVILLCVSGKINFNKPLVSQITADDYGKNINYSVTVKGTELNDWKVFYNDGNNVYIILSGYLENYLTPEATRMEAQNIYGIYWSKDDLKFPYSKSAYEKIMQDANWVTFKNKYAEFAMGTPSVELYAASWNANGYTKISVVNNDNGEYSVGYETTSDMNLNSDNKITTLPKDDKGHNNKLYYPYKELNEECKGYFLGGANASDNQCMFGITCDGIISKAGVVFRSFGTTYDKNFGKYTIRPVICLKSDVRGTVDSSVKIK